MGQDDHEAFTTLYERHYGDVLAYALRRIGEHEARDVTAQTFLVAWRRLDTVSTTEAALPWLYAVARNVLAEQLRSQRRQLRLTRRLEAAAAARALTVHPDVADRLAEHDRFGAALSQLSPRDREVVQLVAWEGLDVKDAATVAGCTATTLAVRLHRARRRIARLLDDEPPPQSPGRVARTEAPR